MANFALVRHERLDEVLRTNNLRDIVTMKMFLQMLDLREKHNIRFLPQNVTDKLYDALMDAYEQDEEKINAERDSKLEAVASGDAEVYIDSDGFRSQAGVFGQK